MMSAGQMLGTRVGHYRPHVMLYVPYATNEDLGDNSFESGHPIMFEHEGGVFATVIVPVADFVPVEARD